jgi:hypothetical protein
MPGLEIQVRQLFEHGLAHVDAVAQDPALGARGGEPESGSGEV